MKTPSTVIIAFSLASCALLLYASTSPPLPPAVALLSALVPAAAAEDDVLDEDDDGDDDTGDDGDDDTGDDAGDDSPNDDDSRNGEQPTDDDQYDEADSEHTSETGPGPGRSNDNDEDLDSQGYIVKMAEILAIDADDTSLELIEALGFAVLRRQNLDALNISIAVIETPAGLSVREAIRRLRQSDPDALYEFNHLYQAMPAGGKHHASPDVRQPAMASATGTRLGLIDTAVDTAHETLRGRRIIQQSFVDGDNPPMAHGTSIASLLVGKSGDFQGLLPGATLYSAVVFSQHLSGSVKASADSLAAALNWLVKQRVSVINMSLAGPPNALLQVAVRETLQRGHAVIAAVGNDGPAAPPLYPAAYAGVIAVTAVDNQQRIYRRANRGRHVDFAAPGVKIRAADPRGGYATFSGTSYAAPVVSALLAQRLETPDLARQRQVLAQLQQQAVDLGADGRDPVFGYGLIGEAQHATH